MLKRTILAFLLIPSSALFFSFAKPVNQQVLRTIIVDAGHGIKGSGGHDGAKGSFSYEDDICLAISKKLVGNPKKKSVSKGASRALSMPVNARIASSELVSARPV